MRRIVLFLLMTSVQAFADGSGKFILEGNGFTSKTPEPVANGEGRVDFIYDRDFRLSRFWSFKFHPSFRATSVPDSWGSQAIVDPRELNFENEKNGRAFRFGFITPKWEGTDGVNPMDIASMKDWSDPLRAQTMASAALQFSKSGDGSDFEIFFVPKQTRSVLFAKKTPWLPRSANLPLSSQEVRADLPDRVEYEFDARDEFDHALSNNAGLRLQLHGDSVDFAIAAFEGAADMPTVQPVLNGTFTDVTPGHEVVLLDSPIHFRPIDYRRRTGAVYLSWTLPTATIFRVSARHDQPLGENPLLPGWSDQGVAGLEQSFPVGENTVTVVLQGTFGRSAESGGLLSISDLFDRAILWGLRFPFGENWTVLLSGFSSQHDSSAFAQMEISHRWSDEWSSEFFYQDLGGASGSLTGLLADRDRAGLRLIRAF